jgi:hypothetical protein
MGRNQNRILGIFFNVNEEAAKAILVIWSLKRLEYLAYMIQIGSIISGCC